MAKKKSRRSWLAVVCTSRAKHPSPAVEEHKGWEDLVLPLVLGAIYPNVDTVKCLIYRLRNSKISFNKVRQHFFGRSHKNHPPFHYTRRMWMFLKGIFFFIRLPDFYKFNGILHNDRQMLMKRILIFLHLHKVKICIWKINFVRIFFFTIRALMCKIWFDTKDY